MDDNAPNTKRTGVLGRVVLNDSLESIILRGILTSIAKKEFLTVGLCVGLDLGIKYPLHVLQYEFLGKRAIRGVNFRFPASGTNGCFILGHLGIESLPDIDQDLRGK